MSNALTEDRVFVHGSPRALADCPLEQTTLSKHVQGALGFGQTYGHRHDGFAVRRLHAATAPFNVGGGLDCQARCLTL